MSNGQMFSFQCFKSFLISKRKIIGCTARLLFRPWMWPFLIGSIRLSGKNTDFSIFKIHFSTTNISALSKILFDEKSEGIIT